MRTERDGATVKASSAQQYGLYKVSQLWRRKDVSVESYATTLLFIT